MLDAVYRYRARRSARRLAPWLRRTDRGLDIRTDGCGLRTAWHGPIGNQMGLIGACHMMLVSEPVAPLRAAA